MAQSRFKLLRWGWRLLFLSLLIAGWTLALAALHVVVVPAESGSAPNDEWRILLLPKNRLSLRNTFVDTRSWTPADAARQETLLSRLVEAGHASRLGHVLGEDLLRRLDGLLRARRSALTEPDRQ